MSEITDLRQRGWRPRGQVCEGCRKRTWGPGAGREVWERWERKRDKVAERVEDGGKGKRPSQAGLDEDGGRDEEGDGELVLFACRHLWHRKCLVEKGDDGTKKGLVCLVCSREGG